MAAIAGIAAVATTAASGIMGAGAAKKAAGQQTAALQQALDFQKSIYGDVKGYESPFISAGTSALGPLLSYLGLPGGTTGSDALGAFKAFQQTPYYTFPLQQGIESMDRSAAARGIDLSPGQMASVNKYGTGYASQGFSSFVDALRNLAGMGQSGIGTLGQVGTNIASQVGQTETNIGNAQAQGTMAQNNFLTKALGSIPMLFNPSTYTGTSAGGQATTPFSGISDWYNSWFGGGNNNYGFSPAVNANAPDYTGGATPTQLSLLGLSK